MMAHVPRPAAERLQPSLLDRLTERGPDDGTSPRPGGTIGKAGLRKAVLLDLEWLFNAVQPHPEWSRSNPALAATVINFGLPPLAGQTLSRLDVHELERTMAQAIRDFEPRILPATLTVRALPSEAVLDSHNRIEFEIRGQLWAEPQPLEILLRTQFDLEAGQVKVVDPAAAAVPPRPAF